MKIFISIFFPFEKTKDVVVYVLDNIHNFYVGQLLYKVVFLFRVLGMVIGRVWTGLGTTCIYTHVQQLLFLYIHDHVLNG